MSSYRTAGPYQSTDLLCGTTLAGGTSFNSLTGGSANGIDSVGGVIDLMQLTPARGRLGVEEIPFAGQDPIPDKIVPPPSGGWGTQATREDTLRRFTNRDTKGLNGGGRSADITRFTPQLIQWQQDDDSSRLTSFERNQPSQARRAPAYP